MKRIALFFDGTWNKPGADDQTIKSDTNVCHLYRATPDQRIGADQQETWYDQGVGTHFYDRIRGGLYGYGLDHNIQQGYAFLLANYEPDSQVYLFGFSRGAYSARSLAGWLRKCGLLWHSENIETSYALYRDRAIGVDDPQVNEFVDKNARRIPIHFIGVWDTVGALGIPLHILQWFNQAEYAFHDVELSSIVRNAYQAIALDERREDYMPCIWSSKPKDGQTVEQVWFAGAHADIGGGYPPDHEVVRISNLALAWIADKAEACGLKIEKANLPSTAQDYLATIHDSYRDFLDGVYSMMRQPYMRPVNLATGSTQDVHDSVMSRIRMKVPTYRPLNPGFPP